MLLTFRQLQIEQQEWEKKNFPDNQKHFAMLGLLEEVGELAHALLKMEQGIRGTKEEHMAAAEDAVGDITVYLSSVCSHYGIDFQGAVDKTWPEVQKRDWIKYPKDGLTE
jgi:NTP pyrophosphatase (non-canonical NTP hydrolase)